MLLFTPARVSLLLAAPVLSAVTLTKPIAEKQTVVDLTYDIPKTTLLAQIQRTFGKLVHSWSVICSLSSPRNSPMGDGFSSLKTQTNATWGLARITQADKLQEQNPDALDFEYSYDKYGGEGVDIYVIDSGVYLDHVEFGGRAVWGATFIPDTKDTDLAGHGTHVAATIAGNRFGVAKAARIIAVKVLDHKGKPTKRPLLSALKWVKRQVDKSDRPSVVHVSIHGKPSDAVDRAAAALVAKGVHVITSAGIHGIDAKETSPARVPGVLTVGVININDAKTNFSNYGSVVDIFAPGENIISAGIFDGPDGTAMKSGCSIGTAYVTGTIAYLISKFGNMSPAAMKKLLQSMAIKDALTGIPSGTVNLLVQRGRT